MGDLNVDFLDKDSKRKSSRLLRNFAISSSLSQLINAPTRVTDQSQTMIDLIFVNNEHRIIDSGVIPMPLSDHFLVYCTLKTGVRKAVPKVIEYRSYKYFNADSFLNDLEHVPWHVVEDEANIDDAVLTWNTLFSDVADVHAPIKKRRVQSKIKESMRDGDYHHRKAIKSNSNYHWNMYRKLRNLVNREVK